MMRPKPRLFMAGNARRIRWNGADRLTANASFPSLRRKCFDRRKMPDHRVVDQDIDGTDAAEQVGHHGFDGMAQRQVGSDACDIDVKARP